MTGQRFQELQSADLLFEHFFENNIASWLWFHLKLASFQFKAKSDAQGMLIDYQAQALPLSYQAYFLENLVQEVTEEKFRERI